MKGADRVAALLDELKPGNRLADKQKQETLEQIKTLGRDSANGAPLRQKKYLDVLLEYAFGNGNQQATSHEAMRCVANTMLLHESTRQIVVDSGSCHRAADKLTNPDDDTQFLAARILFFSTYAQRIDLKSLVRQHSLATSIETILAKHAALPIPQSSSDMSAMAMAEVLKLLTNILVKCPELITDFAPCIAPVATLLLTHTTDSHAMTPATSLLINALMSLDLVSQRIEDSNLRSSLFPADDESALTGHLTHILDKSLASSADESAEMKLPPLIILLTKLYDTAPDTVKISLQTALLPSAESRNQPLGRDDTISSRLLRHMTSPLCPQLNNAIGELFFELSSRDATMFIRNIGYGYAIGFLTMHGIAVPPEALDQGSQGINPSEQINAVTGQRLDKETSDDLPEMTEEEKEREAERLFVLFERLKATGVVDVQNPVHAAIQNGQLG